MADIIYQGRNLTPVLKNDGGQAMGRLSDAIIKAEETKYNAFKQNEKEFLANSKIDPVLLINDSNQRAQTKALSDFNNKWASEYKKYQGNLPTEIKQQMQSEKSVIIGQQQKMQADMARALQDRDIVSKDIAGNIDREDADKRWKDYILTGTYDTTPLKPNAIDPDAYLSKRANKGTGTQGTITITTNKDGKVITEKKVASATEDEARAMVEADMVSNPRLAMGYIKKFQALKTTDPETYIKYLDTTGDGKVDASEEQASNSASNPIIKWAQDNYWQKRIDIQEAETTKPQTTPSANKFGFTISWGGKNTAVPVGQKRKVGINYGGEVKNNLYSFGGSATLSDFPTDGASALYDTSKEPLQGGTNIAGQLVDYDADSDKLIIRTTTSNETLGLDPKQLVEIDANIVPDVNNLPIMVDGKQTTLGTLRGTKPKPTVKTSGVTWKTKK